MSEHIIPVEAGTTTVLPTAGIYCDRNIVIMAEGGGGNAGIPTLTVTIAEGQASHTPKEIYDHIQNGGTAVFKTEQGYYFQLSHITESAAEFRHADYNNSYCVNVYSDKLVELDSRTIPSDDAYYELRCRVEQLEGNSSDLTGINLSIEELRNKPHLSEANVQTLIDASIAKIAVYNGEVEDV